MALRGVMNLEPGVGFAATGVTSLDSGVLDFDLVPESDIPESAGSLGILLELYTWKKLV